MTTLFASDVHLSDARPEAVDAFVAFLAGPARSAAALYLLGDVFDMWLGDDDDRPPHPAVQAALAALTGAGVPVSVVHGNHDFLISDAFAARTGCALLGDETLVDLHGARVLLMHGDTLCTRDTDYQEFRRYTRDPDNQAAFLALPLAARLDQAAAIRHRSQGASRLKPEDIMDVTPDAVVERMRAHRADVLVHGHTHRPGVHPVALGGATGRRIVLGDWYDGDSVLAWDASGCRLSGAGDLDGGVAG